MDDARPWLEWWHREGQPHVRTVVWTQWDPLGLASDPDWPRDEYEMYEQVLGSKLRRGSSAADLAAYLADFLSPEEPSPAWGKRCATAAHDLVAWYREAGAPS